MTSSQIPFKRNDILKQKDPQQALLLFKAVGITKITSTTSLTNSLSCGEIKCLLLFYLGWSIPGSLVDSIIELAKKRIHPLQPTRRLFKLFSALIEDSNAKDKLGHYFSSNLILQR